MKNQTDNIACRRRTKQSLVL